MFFNYSILIKPGGRFFLVWRLVHQPRSSVSREDVDKLNIPELSDAVISHIPETAGYAELPYSLYLQAQLMHGITLVFSKQVGFFLKDVEEAANALKPVITKIPKKLQKRKIEEDEFELPEFEDIFSKAAKRKRGGKPHPLEDFSLMLLKHGQVKAAQQSAYGEILVRTASTE
ncbi:Meiotic recombination protein REC8-like protein [Aphelenchoides avenae]|nr:Meiotic recombination protein REC8-like protein [Aphelenchus avenae]